MDEIEAMKLLAGANPVQPDDLTPMVMPDRVSRSRADRRVRVAVGVVALAGAAALLGSGLNHLAAQTARHSYGGLTNGSAVIGDLPLVSGLTNGGGRLQGATGGTGPTGPHGPTGRTGVTGPDGYMGRGSLATRFHRNDVRITSIGVSAWDYKPEGFTLRVIYFGPRGDYGRNQVVYQEVVSADDMAPLTGKVGPLGRQVVGPTGPTARIWSTTLDPNDWIGGCKLGDYEIDIRNFGVDSDTFSCVTNPQPTYPAK
jgi:hypothetical protein